MLLISLLLMVCSACLLIAPSKISLRDGTAHSVAESSHISQESTPQANLVGASSQIRIPFPTQLYLVLSLYTKLTKENHLVSTVAS